MKLYRCMLGVLLVFFITLAVIFGVSYYNERRSIEDGILILGEIESVKGEKQCVAGEGVC